MASIFTKIIKGEIPCYKIAETEKYFAFLDINPLMKGHTLCIPKKEIDNIFDLDDETLSGLMIFSKKIAKAIKKVVPCNRVGVTVVGDEVPHAHIHLIPFNTVKDMMFNKARVKLSKEEFIEIAKQINANLT